MAYVGTPSILGNARTTLASIIQGEAGGEGLRGMQAVAQVISNRASQNFSGYGTDLVSQATARNQFQGQSTGNISANAYTAADQALSGNLPNVVGNGAVNYANPGASSASWARALNSDNSFQLGNHFFTDNTKGNPYSPDLTANGNTASSSGGLSTAPGTAGGITTDAGDGTITSMSTNADGSANVTLGGSDGSTSGFGSIGGVGSFDSTGGFTSLDASGGVGAASVTSGLPSSLSGSTPSLDGATLDSGVSASSLTGSGDDIAGYNSAGPVVANPALVGATNSVASATQKGDQGIQQGVTKAGQTIGQSITSSTSSILSWASDSLLRVFVLVVGIALFAGALYYFGKPAIDNAVQKIPKVIPV